MKKRRNNIVPLGDLIGAALRDMGMPSAALTQRVQRAWDSAADSRWAGHVTLLRLQGGVLVVGVDSASLRQDLAQFHHDRLLSVLKVALPETTLVAIRFTAEVPARSASSRRPGGSR